MEPGGVFFSNASHSPFITHTGAHTPALQIVAADILTRLFVRERNMMRSLRGETFAGTTDGAELV